MIKIIWEKVLDILVTTVGQPYVDKWQMNLAVGESISNLQVVLPKAHLLIERSECWRLPEYRPVDELLPQLKDAVYDAESIVSELEYQNLKNEVEKSPGIAKTFVMNWMNDFPITVKRVIDRLNNVYNEMKETCHSRRIPKNPSEFSQTARPITTTTLETPKVYGREKELMEVITLLGVSDSRSGRRKRGRNQRASNLSIGESSSSMDNNKKVSVLPIVGMGGVGKTTLAQMVCNERIVKSHFDLIMWVCVSDKFDRIRITREMLESATNKECNITNPDTVEKNLLEKLKSKRFLLVLDDVWCQEWQSLLALINRVEGGGVVMVTTRSLKCLENIAASIDIKESIDLEGLEEHIYWDFFRCCAFGSVENANNYPALEIIGQEICGRLKGSPLAAKTMGGLLRANVDERHWRNIKEDKIWKLSQKEHDILPELLLSYQYLPSQLKKCFSFCSLYPKDFKFTKWELINLWVMQGFIELQPGFNIYWEDPYIKEAEVCFRELVQRCFFQNVVDSYFDEYVIHDLMHDVCLYVTKDECFCIEDAEFEKSVSINIRHLSISGKGIKKEEQVKLCKYAKLLYVRVGPQSSCFYTVINKWCEKLTNIRSLSIPKCKFKYLPKSIGKLKHLQYLDISFSDINELPESFCSLYNLLYLNMKGCSNFMFFPEGFENLVNLRFLCLPAEKLILVSHMENSARKIDCKNVSFEVSTHGKIENLKFMNNLRGELTIKNLELVLSKQSAEEAHLNKKQLIDHLRLCWSEYKDPVGGQSARVERRDEEVLQGLCPHPNLKKLMVRGYGGGNLKPSWLTEQVLPNLTEVSLISCINKTIYYLPRFITDMEIWGCYQLTDLQNCLGANHLPGLQKLAINNCPELVSIAIELFGEFLSLQELTISNCPKLTSPNAVPILLPPSIKKLSLRACGNIAKSIPRFLPNLTPLETLNITGCPNLLCISAEATSDLISRKVIPIENYAELQPLGNLYFGESEWDLKLENCSHLVFISSEVTSDLKSLKRLYIEDCAALESLDGLRLLANLKDLNLKKCPRLASMTAEVLRNLKSLSELRIQECAGLQLIRGLEFLESLQTLSIQSCPCLKSIQVDAVSLQRLFIRNCPRLESIQADAASNLTSLIILDFQDCDELQSLGGLLNLRCNIYIQRCPKLQETRGQDVRGFLPPALLAELPSSSSGVEGILKRSRD